MYCCLQASVLITYEGLATTAEDANVQVSDMGWINWHESTENYAPVPEHVLLLEHPLDTAEGVLD